MAASALLLLLAVNAGSARAGTLGYAPGDPGYADVINSAGTDLTGPARTIIENPTFLTSEPAQAAAVGDTASEFGLTDLLFNGGAVFADAIPWVGGGVAAATICNAFFSHCFGLFGNGAQPAQDTSNGWSWNRNTGPGQTITQRGVGGYVGAYQYYTGSQLDYVCFSAPDPAHFSAKYFGAVAPATNGFCNGTLNAQYADWFAYDAGVGAGGAGGVTVGSTAATTASPSTGHYCVTGASSCTTTLPATSTITAGVATCLTHGASCGLTPSAATAIGTYIASSESASGSGTSPPSGQPTASPFTATFPNCIGDTDSTCRGLLAGDTWQSITTTVVQPAQADLTKPAGAVISTSPAAGAVVSPATTNVTLTENPTPLPLALPAPNAGETYQAYTARLQGLGFVGTITETDLDGSQLDPTQGPGVAIRTTPAAGTQVAANTAITVYANPGAAAGSGTATGAPTAPAIPAVNLSPLSQASSCTTFPFGIFCWFSSALGGWSGGNSCPSWTVPFTHGNLPVNLCQFNPAMDIVRPVITVVAMLGMVWLFASSAMGFGGGGEADQ